MRVEHTNRGWIAMSEGLASRAATREEAERRQRDAVALVRRLAGTTSPTVPQPPSERSPSAPQG